MIKNVIVLTHMGMGDITCISPAIRYYAEKYENVYIACKSRYFENCLKLYEDINNINILKLSSSADDNANQERLEIDNFVNNFDGEYELLTCGIYKKSHKPFDCLPDNFYMDLGLELDVYEKYFSLSKNLYNNEYFNNIIGKYRYIFVHGKTSILDYTDRIISNIVSDDIILCPSKNCYPKNHEYYDIAESVIDLPFFDYVPLIMNANEIHLIASSFSCLSKFISPTGIKKCLYNYSNCGISKNFLKDWTIIGSEKN
jgi:hypothetical protein